MDNEMSVEEMEAIFNENEGISSNSSDQQKHEVDLDKIKMNSNTDFKGYDSPPNMVHMGKIDDGSLNKQQFVLVKKTSQSGKTYCDIYLKAGVLFKTREGSKSIMAGEMNYEHGMIDKAKKRTVFVYDNQSYFGYDVQDYIEMGENKK